MAHRTPSTPWFASPSATRWAIGLIKVRAFACTHDRRPDTRSPERPRHPSRGSEGPATASRVLSRRKAAASCGSPRDGLAVRSATALHDVGLRAPRLAFPAARPFMITLPATEFRPVVRLEVVVVDPPVGVEAEQVVLGCANLNQLRHVRLSSPVGRLVHRRIGHPVVRAGVASGPATVVKNGG